MVFHCFFNPWTHRKHHWSQCTEYQYAYCMYCFNSERPLLIATGNKFHQRSCGGWPAILPHHPRRAGTQLRPRPSQCVRFVNLHPIRRIRSSRSKSLIPQYCPAMAMVLYLGCYCQHIRRRLVLLFLPPADICTFKHFSCFFFRSLTISGNAPCGR